MDWEDMLALVLVIVGILLFTGILAYSSYAHKQIKYENFQTTISELSDEQKCIHICGFQFYGYLENYKFCLEKCDRISERVITNG